MHAAKVGHCAYSCTKQFDVHDGEIVCFPKDKVMNEGTKLRPVLHKVEEVVHTSVVRGLNVGSDNVDGAEEVRSSYREPVAANEGTCSEALSVVGEGVDD